MTGESAGTEGRSIFGRIVSRGVAPARGGFVMIGLKTLKIAAGAALLIAAMPAKAATLIPAVFNFTTGSNYNVQDGNARIFTATSPTLGTFRVRVTGWSLERVNGTTYIRDSKLMVYSGGLGVISGDDDGGSNNQHTIDNSERRDFIILQFDKHVRPISATFNTYSVNGYARDSDATLDYGTSPLDWTDSLAFLNNANVSALDALFGGTAFTSLSPNNMGNSNTRAINPGEFIGDIWMIGSDFTNADRKIDGFKLTNLAVVPEPATWAMMIGGFGLVGAALRHRRRREALTA